MIEPTIASSSSTESGDAVIEDGLSITATTVTFNNTRYVAVHGDDVYVVYTVGGVLQVRKRELTFSLDDSPPDFGFPGADVAFGEELRLDWWPVKSRLDATSIGIQYRHATLRVTSSGGLVVAVAGTWVYPSGIIDFVMVLEGPDDDLQSVAFYVGYDIEYPSLTLDDDDNIHLAYAYALIPGGDRSLRYMVRDTASDTWSSTLLTGSVFGDNKLPAIEVSGETVTVAWKSKSAGLYEILVRASDDASHDWQAWGVQHTFSGMDEGEDYHDPGIAATVDGRFVVAFHRNVSGAGAQETPAVVESDDPVGGVWTTVAESVFEPDLSLAEGNRFFHLSAVENYVVNIWPATSNDLSFLVGVYGAVAEVTGAEVPASWTQTDRELTGVVAETPAGLAAGVAGQVASIEDNIGGSTDMVWLDGIAQLASVSSSDPGELVGCYLVIPDTSVGVNAARWGRYEVISAAAASDGQDIDVGVERVTTTQPTGLPADGEVRFSLVDVQTTSQPGGVVAPDGRVHLVWLQTNVDRASGWTATTEGSLRYAAVRLTGIPLGALDLIEPDLPTKPDL